MDRTSMADDLCPICGAYWDCECPKPAMPWGALLSPIDASAATYARRAVESGAQAGTPFGPREYRDDWGVSGSLSAT